MLWDNTVGCTGNGPAEGGFNFLAWGGGAERGVRSIKDLMRIFLKRLTAMGEHLLWLSQNLQR